MPGPQLIEADDVVVTFLYCTKLPGDADEDCVAVHGVNVSSTMHKGRIVEKRTRIAAWLVSLPAAFSSGRGASFRQAGQDRNGNLWTGASQHLDFLFNLGIAAELVKCVFKREDRPKLPGGMPYYAVSREAVDLAKQWEAANG